MAKFKVGDIIETHWNGIHRGIVDKVREPGAYGTYSSRRYYITWFGEGVGYKDFAEGSKIGLSTRIVETPKLEDLEQGYEID